MSAAKTIRTRLSDNVVETLERVSQNAGFNVTFKVGRFKRVPDSPDDLHLIVHCGADRLADAADTPQMRTAKWGLYELQIYRFESTASPIPFDELCDVAAADAEKAIEKNPTFGGMSRRIKLLDPLQFEEPNDVGGVIVRFEALYHHMRGNPYSINGE